jgi:hypothetical protein
MPTMRIQDPAEKIKARQELVTGALGDKLKLLSKQLVSRVMSQHCVAYNMA